MPQTVYKKLKEGKFIPRVLHVNIPRSRGTRDQHRALARDISYTATPIKGLTIQASLNLSVTIRIIFGRATL